MGNQPAMTVFKSPAVLLASVIAAAVLIGAPIYVIVNKQPHENLSCGDDYTYVSFTPDELSLMEHSLDRTPVMQDAIERGVRIMGYVPADINNVGDAAKQSAPQGNPPRGNERVFICMSPDDKWIGMVNDKVMLK